ncbi:hypothetical protein Z043_116049 [Scleropages formosus]|uniref:Uncharacterized protein n=1 Tax=Scleropages formosus TaxID=113540 RepID=A0A0P7WV18_SCLFO|nr:hypothetical protein Z043_116049 [Scleropages formosus]
MLRTSTCWQPVVGKPQLSVLRIPTTNPKNRGELLGQRRKRMTMTFWGMETQTKQSCWLVRRKVPLFGLLNIIKRFLM